MHKHIPEKIERGKRLGRHVHHDPRSLNYLVQAGGPSGLMSVRHKRHIPVLQQGETGSCTGNAALGAVGSSPFFDALPDNLKPNTMNPDVAEAQAVQLYSVATTLDQFPGSYPPSDTGSDGLSVAKACKRAGLISGYRHATSLDAALTALAEVPIIVGINWYSSFDGPDARGNVRITRGAFPRGGHEIVMDELDVEGRRVGFTNSWGPEWGVQGRAYLSWDDFARLLSEQGDVTVFVPATEPEPQPAPVPEDHNDLKDLVHKLAQLVAELLTKLG